MTCSPACRASEQVNAEGADISNLSEQEASRLVAKAAEQIKDRASAQALIDDGSTVPLLLHLLRSPNSGEACARWAPSDLLRNASTVAGVSWVLPLLHDVKGRQDLLIVSNQSASVHSFPESSICSASCLTSM